MNNKIIYRVMCGVLCMMFLTDSPSSGFKSADDFEILGLKQ